MFFRMLIYTIKRQARDRIALMMLLLFPIVLILILGTALGGVFEPSEIHPLKVTYFNEDQGSMGRQFDVFILSDDLNTYLDVRIVDTVEQGRGNVADGNVKAFIYIDENYTKNFMSNAKADINIYLQSASQFDMAILEGIFDSFSNGANTINAVMMNNRDPEGFLRVDAIKETPVSGNGRIPGAIDYYAVTMLVMTLMYGTLYGGLGMGEIFHDSMGNRIKTTPASRLALYSGSMLGFVVTIFTQGIIILFFTKYIYGVYWGENIITILGIVFVMSFLAISLGTFVGMLTRDKRVTTGILQTFVPIMTFISSGYFKFQMPDPKVKNLISSIIPNAMAQTAIFNTIYAGPIGQTNKMILIMSIVTIVLIFGAILAERRKLS